MNIWPFHRKPRFDVILRNTERAAREQVALDIAAYKERFTTAVMQKADKGDTRPLAITFQDAVDLLDDAASIALTGSMPRISYAIEEDKG